MYNVQIDFRQADKTFVPVLVLSEKKLLATGLKNDDNFFAIVCSYKIDFLSKAG